MEPYELGPGEADLSAGDACPGCGEEQREELWIDGRGYCADCAVTRAAEAAFDPMAKRERLCDADQVFATLQAVIIRRLGGAR